MFGLRLTAAEMACTAPEGRCAILNLPRYNHRPMTFTTGHTVLVKGAHTIYGKIARVIEDRGDEPSYVVELDPLRCRASDLVSAEPPDSTRKYSVDDWNSAAEAATQWAANQSDHEAIARMWEALRKLGLLRE